MSIIVSAFALGFLAMGLLLLWLGGIALAGRLRAIGRWVHSPLGAEHEAEYAIGDALTPWR